MVKDQPKDKPDGELFEAVDAGAGEQFMAVKPWIGAIMEPTSRKLHFYISHPNRQPS